MYDINSLVHLFLIVTTVKRTATYKFDFNTLDKAYTLGK